MLVLVQVLVQVQVQVHNYRGPSGEHVLLQVQVQVLEQVLLGYSNEG